MTKERGRLSDLNIEESLGRTTPPDLTSRILGAAKRSTLEEAPTPISGAHAVSHSVRPKCRRLTAAIPPRNWQGAGIAAAFVLLLTAGLIAFVFWKSPAQTTSQPGTAGQPQSNENTNHSPSRERWSPAPGSEQELKPARKPEQLKPEDPQPEPDDPIEQPKSEPKRDETVEQPKPKADDTVEELKPEPKRDDTVEQPEPDDAVEQPKESDKTEAQPTNKPAVVATYRQRNKGETKEYPYSVRGADGEWVSDMRADAGGKLSAGAELKINNARLDLVSNALLFASCVLRVEGDTRTLQIVLIEDEFWLDAAGVKSDLMVKYADMEANATNAAGVFEADGGKLKICCSVGEIRCGDEIIRAGEQASLSSKGLSGLRRWSGKHALKDASPARMLLDVSFENEPSNGLIEGTRERRQAFGETSDDWVAVQAGRDAKVSLRFDETVELQPGTQVVIRFRQIGAKKVILQFWNDGASDNFGVDLKAGPEGEWQEIFLPIESFKDRETAKIPAKAGDFWMSGGIYLEGEDTELVVDHIRLVRKP